MNIGFELVTALRRENDDCKLMMIILYFVAVDLLRLVHLLGTCTNAFVGFVNCALMLFERRKLLHLFDS